MAHGPMEQFKIKPLIDLHVGGYDISYTNSALFMTIAVVVSFAWILHVKVEAPSIALGKRLATRSGPRGAAGAGISGRGLSNRYLRS